MPYTELCTRHALVTQCELNYYSPGKIFRFQNIIRAVKYKDRSQLMETSGKQSKAAHDHQKDKYNICFYIKSQTGRSIIEYTHPRSKIKKTFSSTILFPSGCTFMVCRTTVDEKTGIKNVYLREVLLGQGQNVVLWLDENLGKRSLFRHLRWLQLAMRHKDPFEPTDEFVHFIFATHAEIALAYLQSIFFNKLSQNGSDFKLV